MVLNGASETAPTVAFQGENRRIQSAVQINIDLFPASEINIHDCRAVSFSKCYLIFHTTVRGGNKKELVLPPSVVCSFVIQASSSVEHSH